MAWVGWRFFPIWKSARGIREQSYAGPMKKMFSVFDSLQELSGWEENCCQLSHLSLGVIRLVGLLPRPSAALLDREHPYNSRHCLMCRATGCPSCTSVHRRWTVGGGTGKKQERFFFLSQLEIFIATASHPRHHRPPWGACAAGLMATVTRGLIGGCCHFAVAKAGISGGSVFVTWTTHNPVSSWIVTLFHNFPPKTDSLVYVNVWTVL